MSFQSNGIRFAEEITILKILGKTIKINRYPSAQEALMDLASGRVDAVIGDTPVVQQWVTQNGKDQFEVVGKPINNEKYFIGLKILFRFISKLV
mgnify:CR=1 FL=1